MTRVSEPVVVRRDAASDRQVRLADVLIADCEGRPHEEQFAAWFSRFPGLTMVLIVGPDGDVILVRARDGTTIELRLDPSVPVHSAALALYDVWICS